MAAKSPEAKAERVLLRVMRDLEQVVKDYNAMHAAVDVSPAPALGGTAPDTAGATAPSPASAAGFDPVHKDDIVLWYHCCSERFGELAALFDAIRSQCAEHTDPHKLCTLGKEVASDYENMVDCWREELEKGGFRQ